MEGVFGDLISLSDQSVRERPVLVQGNARVEVALSAVFTIKVHSLLLNGEIHHVAHNVDRINWCLNEDPVGPRSNNLSINAFLANECFFPSMAAGNGKIIQKQFARYIHVNFMSIYQEGNLADNVVGTVFACVVEIPIELNKELLSERWRNIKQGGYKALPPIPLKTMHKGKKFHLRQRGWRTW